MLRHDMDEVDNILSAMSRDDLMKLCDTSFKKYGNKHLGRFCLEEYHNATFRSFDEDDLDDKDYFRTMSNEDIKSAILDFAMLGVNIGL